MVDLVRLEGQMESWSRRKAKKAARLVRIATLRGLFTDDTSLGLYHGVTELGKAQLWSCFFFSIQFVQFLRFPFCLSAWNKAFGMSQAIET